MAGQIDARTLARRRSPRFAFDCGDTGAGAPGLVSSRDVAAAVTADVTVTGPNGVNDRGKQRASSAPRATHAY